MSPLRVILGVVLVILAFLFAGWEIAYLILILVLLWLILLSPVRFRRRLLLGYIIFVIALLTSTALQAFLVRSASVQRLIQRISLLRILAGSPLALDFWAFFLGLLIAVFVVWLVLEMLIFISGEFLLNLSPGLKITQRDARRYLWDLVLQQQALSVIVDEGAILSETRPGFFRRFGGPGMLIVRPGNAVVLESLEGTSDIVGAGTTQLRRFEKISHIIDLRPQQELATVRDVLTKDRVPLVFQVNVSFQIEGRGETDTRPDALLEPKHFPGLIGTNYPVYKETIFKAAYNVSKDGWLKETVNALSSSLRDVVFEHSLDELYDAPAAALSESRYIGSRLKPKSLVISTLEEALQARLSQIALAWGVKIHDVDVVTIEMPPEIRHMVLTWWQKRWENEIAKQDADREAKVLLQRAAGKRDALIFESEGEAIARAQWLRQMLQVLLKDNQPLDTRSAMELLRQILAQERLQRPVIQEPLPLPEPEVRLVEPPVEDEEKHEPEDENPPRGEGPSLEERAASEEV